MSWEYTLDTFPASGVIFTGGVDAASLHKRLNEFGAQGWELVSSYATAYANGGTHLLVFVYKRAKSPAPAAIPPIAHR